MRLYRSTVCAKWVDFDAVCRKLQPRPLPGEPQSSQPIHLNALSGAELHGATYMYAELHGRTLSYNELHIGTLSYMELVVSYKETHYQLTLSYTELQRFLHCSDDQSKCIPPETTRLRALHKIKRINQNCFDAVTQF